jgi:VanZ family protein
MRLSSFLPGISWFVLSVILLSLPGDDLPHNDFFNIPFFDKYVHLGMFFILTTLLSYPFIDREKNEATTKKWLNNLLLAAILYGIIMEFVQKYLVYGRSFDVGDIFFDVIGSLIGYIFIRKYYAKKIGPNRNRGRNQN